MLLITAFEPFDGSGVNASLRALEEFLRRDAGLSPVVGAVLPVAFGADTAAMEAALAAHRPSMILHLGQAPRALCGVEEVAVNLRTSTPHRLERIEPDGPPAYFATLPTGRMLDALHAAGCPAESSAHAGAFLCNHVMYRSLHRAATRGPAIPAGFLHVPRLPEQLAALGEVGPSLDLPVTVRGLAAIVAALLDGGPG
jgi:pyroglutamyl-peptidase